MNNRDICRSNPSAVRATQTGRRKRFHARNLTSPLNAMVASAVLLNEGTPSDPLASTDSADSSAQVTKH
jgi:hypothetical protein